MRARYGAQMSTRVVEVFYFDGCPGAAPALAAVNEVVERFDLRDVDVRLIAVGGAGEAEALRFLGSPSIRVDGVDVETGADAKAGFALRCRLYAVGGGIQKVPPTSWIESALRRG